MINIRSSSDKKKQTVAWLTGIYYLIQLQLFTPFEKKLFEGQVPIPPRHYMERNKEESEIVDILIGKKGEVETRCVAIKGKERIGKTTLAVRIA